MIPALLITINVILVIIAAVTLINTITAPMLQSGPPLTHTPRVSVLIPARNEAHNLDDCLSGLLTQDYPDLEILILNDQSTDDTQKVIAELTAKNPKTKLRAIDGQDLPAGWTGKNHACHQLAQHATGEILIFTDADNQYSPNAVSSTVGWMQKQDLDMLSAFPQQTTKTLAEKLVVPVMDMFVYCLLPLRLTLKSRRPSLAAANGQWLAFTRDGYTKIGGHYAVKGEIVEDTTLARLAKTKGLNFLTLSGKNTVTGRMYRNWGEIFHGFSKNAFGLWGYNLPGFIIFLSMMFLVFILPYFLLFLTPGTGAVAAVMLNIVIRLLLVIKFNQPVISIFMHPIGIALVSIISVHSVYRYYRGSITWKGRNVIFQK